MHTFTSLLSRTVLATLVAYLCISPSSFAQYQLYVSAPSSVAGRVADVATPTDRAPLWGFGNPANVAGVCGVAVYGLPDSLGNDTNAVLAGVRGKICVLKRIAASGSPSSMKAYTAQKNGAIGCIIINDGPISGTFGASVVGARVNIPVIWAPLSWENTVRSFIKDGTLNVCIGTLRGLFDNNLSLQASQVAPPSPLSIPDKMIYAPGHFAFTAGANVINLGSAAQSNVKLIATVERVSPNPAPLWKDSAVIGNMPALGTSGDTSFDGGILSKFDLVQAVPGPYPTDRRGRYRLTYKVSQSNVDALPDDNSMAFDFYVTDNAWSRTRLKPDSNFKPITTSGNTRAASSTGERTIKWGQILQTTDYTAQLDSVMYGNSTGGTDKLAGIETAVEVYEWVDADTNGGVSDGEITLLGASSRLYQSENQQSKFFTDGVSDVNSGAQGVKLEANKTYLVLYANTGSTAVFLNCDNVNFSHFFAVDPNNRATAINLAPNWYYGFTGQNTTPAFRVVLSEIVPTTVKPRLSNTIDLRLFPNPATDHVQVNVSDAIATGKATIQIMDLAGRLVAEETHSLQSGTSSYKLSTAALQGGIYNVRVSTPRGSKVQKLVIAR